MPSRTPQAELASRVAELEQSGAVDPASQWPQKFAELVKAWSADAKEFGAHLDNQRCFAAGCEVTVVYPDRANVQSLTTKMRHDDATLSWPGAKFRSGIIGGDGATVSVTWIVFIPKD